MPEAENDEFEQEDDIYGDIDQSNDFLDSDEAEKKEDKLEYTDEEKEQYGKAMSKRIGKEVSKRKVLEDQNRVLNERLSTLEDNIHSQNNKSVIDDIDSRMASLKLKRDEMYELGDIDGDVEDEWQDLRLEKRDAEYQKRDEPVKREPQQAPKQPPVQKVPDAQQEWLDENEWYSKGGDTTKQANDVFQELLDEGYDTNHDGMYKEFDKRLSKDDKSEPVKREPGAPPPATPRGGGDPPKPRSKLSNDDFDMMTEMGMDPRNPEHRKQLLANKRA